MNSRARNGESSASACENFTFHGQQVWEMCRYNRFEITPTSGQSTLGQGRRPDTSRTDLTVAEYDAVFRALAR